MFADTEAYVYKKEIDWSLLLKGLTLPVEKQALFLKNMEATLRKQHHIDYFVKSLNNDANPLFDSMNPMNLQYIMGHSEIAVTMDTYTELGFDDAMTDFYKIMGMESKDRENIRAVN